MLDQGTMHIRLASASSLRLRVLSFARNGAPNTYPRITDTWEYFGDHRGPPPEVSEKVSERSSCDINP